jgi:threonine dehydrogenase-like Zn-dependent dehydrogenase
MSDSVQRMHRAGQTITDICRACKAERDHTVIAVDGEGRVLRVACGFCGSQHNYRGGGEEPRPAPAAARPAAPAPRLAGGHEGTAHVATADTPHDLEALLRRVVREELGLTPGLPAPKWRGGQVALRPGRPGLQEKVWPIDALFHKIVMVRNRLRTLEQQLNAAEIPEDLKLRLQAYVTACYGSLTSFNVLFGDEADQFRGAGGSDRGEGE